MDLTRLINLYQKDYKTYEDLKELDENLQTLIETDSGFFKLTQSHRFQVIRKLTLHHFQDKQLIFSKGDPSDCLYIILNGSLQLYKTSLNGFQLPEKVISTGTIGERGILKNKNRSLTATAHGPTHLLKLDARTFRKYLIEQFTAENQAKKAVVEKYIPCISLFTEGQKEKLAYSIKIQSFAKGKVILQKGGFVESMMIVLEGECAMMHDIGFNKRIVALLDNGSIIGEDSAFFERSSVYYVIVTSDIVKVAAIKVNEIKNLFPSSVIAMLRDFFTQRSKVRYKLATFTNPCLPKTCFSSRNLGTSALILASPRNQAESSREKQMLKSLSFTTILNKNKL